MKNIKSTIVFLIIAIVIILGITLLANNTKKSPTTQTETPVESESNLIASYTLAEVTTHSTPTNCWTIVRTNVYDLTSWIAKHPGGDKAILSMCGKDATTAFEGQHGGQENPEKALASFQIGIYKK